ncbi:MAG: hypothetical protein CL679_14790 [Bermanella sp.]|jgi:uncharacterized membrane protein YoaK (UPF0700 family)|nr:hypothetical protein [Bermanella sp.]|tara:strand:+ start:790 stop:1068 length:279 start_codon:yes stop_codon:yes gene_type:complete
MKASLRALFSPILNIFESGDEPYLYKPSQRTILLAVSVLFTILIIAICAFSWNTAGFGFLIPVVVFSCVALVGYVVGLLGNERAVAKIWGNK